MNSSNVDYGIHPFVLTSALRESQSQAGVGIFASSNSTPASPGLITFLSVFVKVSILHILSFTSLPLSCIIVYLIAAELGWESSSCECKELIYEGFLRP